MDKRVNIEKIKNTVKYIFDSYKNREIIEEQLEMSGFSLWGYLNDYHGRPNRDEQVWAYDKGVPNGQVLLLVNWIDGFYWIYEKTDRGDIV